VTTHFRKSWQHCQQSALSVSIEPPHDGEDDEAASGVSSRRPARSASFIRAAIRRYEAGRSPALERKASTTSGNRLEATVLNMSAEVSGRSTPKKEARNVRA
jgi:hypothetical protein